MDLPDGYHAVPPGKLATVVTYLEMTAAPTVTPRPAPAGYDLTRVTRWDTDAFRRLYVTIGHEWMWSSRLLLSEAELEARLHRPGTEAYVPRRNGEIMGCSNSISSGRRSRRSPSSGWCRMPSAAASAGG